MSVRAYVFVFIFIDNTFWMLKTELDNQKKLEVDLDNRTHMCKEFDYDQLSREHAIAVIEKVYLKKFDYYSKWYTSKNLRKTYNGVVNLVGDRE